jgi:DNA-binding transcriptional LysR family regulator
MADSPLPPADLDLRLLESFVAVAGHRHFGRAADALHTTQPSLTRQIRRLERQVGVRLIDRTPRGSRLTEAGQAFLPQAQALLRSAATAVAAARAAALASRITVGYTSGLFVTSAVRELRHRHPGADVRTLALTCDEPPAALLDHRVDVVVARLLFPVGGLRVTPLYNEPRVLVIPRGHRLAGKESVTLDDIADEPLARVRNLDPAWDALWRVDPRPDGRPAPAGPVAETLADKFELIAAGQAAIISAGPHATGIRPDLITIPIEGIEPGHVVVAHRADDRSPLVTTFRTCAQEHLTGNRAA